MTRELVKNINEGRGRLVMEKKTEKENAPPQQTPSIKDLIPSPPRETINFRPKTGIQKLGTKVMTDPEAMEVIKENHMKKQEKKKKDGEKEKVVQKALQANRTMKLRQRKGIKSNPKLYVWITRFKACYPV